MFSMEGHFFNTVVFNFCCTANRLIYIIYIYYVLYNIYYILYNIYNICMHYTYILFFIFFPFWLITGIFRTVPCAIQQDLVYPFYI